MSKQALKTAIRDHQKRTGANYTQARREVLSTEHDTTPKPFIAQAASSTDPAVLQAIEDLDLLDRHFFHLRKEFVERVTGDGKFYASRSAWSSRTVPRMMSLHAEEKPKGEFGRWKQGPQGRGWVPAKNSAMEEEFDALNAIPSVSIPGATGVQGMLLGRYIVTPTIFSLDGKAWLRFDHDPEGHADLTDQTQLGTNWVRERNSDAVRAIEDHNARFAGKPFEPLSEAEKERVVFLFAEQERRDEERRLENERFWAERKANAKPGQSYL